MKGLRLSTAQDLGLWDALVKWATKLSPCLKRVTVTKRGNHHLAAEFCLSIGSEGIA